MRLPTLLLPLLLATLVAGAAQAASSRHAAKQGPARIAVVVGNNLGMADEVELRYAEDDARKMERALLDLGGYQRGNTHLVLGASADEVRAVLDEVRRQTEDAPGAMVFFYYSGHADAADLHLSQSRLGLDEVRAFLEGTHAQVRVALVDACKSGALIRAKGASVGPAFDIDVVQPPGVSGTIVITSSSDDEVAQESDRLGGSFFTHYWVHGLYGEADADDDEQITLEEAYRFAHFSTLSHTIASSGGVQHPKYELDLSGEGPIVVANLARRTAALKLKVGAKKGDWYILDADRRFLLTEIASVDEAAEGLRLPPGRYRIKKREPRRVLVVDVELTASEVRVVSEDEMQTETIGTGEAKGADASLVERVGLFQFRGHGPFVRMGARAMPFSAFSPGPQVELGWRVGWKYMFVEPRLSLSGGNLVAQPSTLLFEADLGSSAGLQLPVGPVRVAGGVDAGLVLPQQASIAQYLGSRFWSSPTGLLSVAVQGRAFGEIAFDLPGDFAVAGRAYGGVAGYSLSGNVIALPVFGSSLGVSYRF
jgi:hypothetical protein